MMGDMGLGLETGSALERILENDMTPAARLGVPEAAGALDEGTGDSVRASAGNAPEDAPLVPGLVIGACLMLGDAIVCGLADGLIDPAVGAGWEWDTGLRGGKLDVPGEA
jgi:hypothetical protein